MTTLKPRLCYALNSIEIKAILNGTLIYTSKNPKTLVSTNTLLVLEVTTRKGYLRTYTVTEVTYNLFYWDFRQNPEQIGKKPTETCFRSTWHISTQRFFFLLYYMFYLSLYPESISSLLYTFILQNLRVHPKALL